jgi:predicted nucleotidyltransferase
MVTVMDTNLESRIKHVTGRFPYLRVVILFGSSGTGRDSKDSDIDLAVAGERPLDSNQKTVLIEALAEEFGRPIDVVDLVSAHGPVLRQILTKGCLIYRSDSAMYAHLLIRMVGETADFEPYRNRILEERRKAWIGR